MSSRSLYGPPRGEKRRRDDGHEQPGRHDPRSFRVRYEDEQSSLRSRSSRSRSRSRSPYRRHRDTSRYEELGKNQVPSSVTAQSQATKLPHHSKNEAKFIDQTTAPRDVSRTASSSPQPYRAARAHSPSNTDDQSEAPKNEQTGEDAIIAARRRRREQIKKLYQDRSSPSVVAHHPTVVELSAPTSASTPATPASTISDPRSPAELTLGKDEDISNHRTAFAENGDEPSAADYDPTVDMRDERARHDGKMFKEDEISRDQDEVSQQQEVNGETGRSRGLAIEAAERPSSEDTDGLDMFAEGSDDDMFAENFRVNDAKQPKTAEALDAGMMDNWDDPQGYYITILGELIDQRYKVTQNLGKGMFASVVRAVDVNTEQEVAIKVVRNNKSMKTAGYKECEILELLAGNDPENRRHVIRLLRSFEHKEHLCMVFENMSMNLRDVLKKFGRDVGINLNAIRVYAQHLFLGLSLMKQCEILHADLKPDNILVNEARNVIKIADLGSASPITENVTAPYLVSRFYRAPELILGIDYDYGIDMWSTGCTLFELFTGKILFPGRNNNDMIRTIMECRGRFPPKVLRKGKMMYDHFDDLLAFHAQQQDKVSGRVVTKTIDFKAKPERDLRSRLMPNDRKVSEPERKELELFIDLLDRCLDLRPQKRITPNEALRHPFIKR